MPSALRWFRAATWVLVALASVHLIPVVQSNFVPPTTEPEMRLKELALSIRQKMGPLEPTVWGGIQILNISYSVLVFFVAAVNLATARAVSTAGGLAGLSAINAAFCVLLTAIPLLFQFPPPAIFALIAAVLYAVAWRKSRGAAGATDA